MNKHELNSRYGQIFFFHVLFLVMSAILPNTSFSALPEVEIELSVNSFPVQEVEFNTNIYFDAVITDPDGDVINAYRWESSLDGEFSTTSPPFWDSTLGIGNHVITLSVIDSSGEVGTDIVNLTVLPTDPTAEILSPLHLDTLINNNPFSLTDPDGNPVVFQGNATDLQDDKNGMDDGDITLEWDFVGSDGLSEFTPKYRGELLPPLSNLPADTYTIFLTATDSDGNTDTDEITIIVIDNDAFAPINVDIIQPSDTDVFQPGEMITFQGSGEDASGLSLTGDSLVWTSNQDGELGRGEIIRKDDLSLGEHIITLTATDSDGRSSTISSATYPNPITITLGNTLPVTKAVIASPIDSTSFTPGQAIVFQGYAEDADEEEMSVSGLTFEWTSSLEEPNLIGEGSVITATNLREGAHTITLTIKDSKGVSVSDNIVIYVSNAPNCTITSPVNDTSYESGTTILFTAVVTDSGGGNMMDGSVVWTSNKEGNIGSGLSFSQKFIDTGTYLITMTATDADGLHCSDTVTIHVGTGIPFIEKKITVSPASGPYYVNDYIQFEVEASDKEDGPLTGSNLVWASNLETDPIGTGEKIIINSLSEGEHLITLTATDNDENFQTDFIIINILNRAPDEKTILIMSPLDQDSFKSGELITFHGSAEDPEEGPLTGTSLVWTSSRGDTMGTGEIFTTSTLSTGTHIITLTATDSNGKSSSQSITIIVENADPVAEITAPEDGAAKNFGEAITFEGAGTDNEDGNIPSSQLVWYRLDSSSDTPEKIGTGNILSVDDLPRGNNIIRLTATDSEGATASDEIVVIVGNANPVATITKPFNNSIHGYGESIIFTGTGTDPDGGSTTLSWSSDVNGLLGTGSSITVTDLSVGEHEITLTVTDSSGLTDTDTITIFVADENPVATITKPFNDSIHGYGESIIFTGTGTDPDGGSTTLSWYSDVNGLLGTGSSITVMDLSVGEHEITLTVTDSSGLTDTDTITITIIDEGPATVNITSPQDGDTFSFEEYINFEGNAQDNEDGEITGTGLVWTSNLESSTLGTGKKISINSLSLGEHLITLTATDSNGVFEKDFITITVESLLPEQLLISYPVDGASFDEGEIINFAGSAFDAEDGALRGSALLWKSDIDGYIGSGAGFSTSLSQGEHIISMSATDSDGGVSTTSISLSINGTSESLPLSLDNPDVKTALNQVVKVNISNGHPPYRLYEDYPEIAVFELTGNVISIFPQTTGITTAQVYDHENSIVILKLTVTESTDDVPLADAGPDQNVEEGSTVVLNASASFPGSYGIASFKWIQTSGDEIIVLSDAAAEKATFVAPIVDGITTVVPLSFSLTVIDNNGTQGLDDVRVNVYDNGIKLYPSDAFTFMTGDMVTPLGIKVVGDGDLVSLKTFYPEVITDTRNRPGDMPYGIIDFSIKVDPAAAATIILYLPESLSSEYYPYKYSSTLGWYRFDTNATYDSDREKIFFSLVDGGQGDDDGLADGIIKDPFAFGRLPGDDSNDWDNDSGDDNSSGSSGGGCFISTLLE